MIIKNFSRGRSLPILLVVVIFFAVLILLPLTSCDFGGPCRERICELLEEAKLKELTDSQRNVVFEEQGTIIVYHGFGCAASNKPDTQDVVKVEQSLDLPAYATNATVLLNGWHLNYLHDDHNIAGLGTLISNIRLERNTLKWQASGVISDDNFDDPYNWCYYYTVVGWDPNKLNLIVDHKDGNCNPNDNSDSNFYFAQNKGTSTALSSFASFLKNPDFAGKTVAIAPRGFGFSFECLIDHNFFQIGYNLEHNEGFVENGKSYKKKFGDVVLLPSPTPSPATHISQQDPGLATWETYTIFKDDDTRRFHFFGEMVSGLAGTDLRVLQPPFSILPIEGESPGSEFGGTGVRTEEFAIDNIPAAFAIPVLTGWELHYLTNDQNVKEIGIWIDEFHYRDPADPPGRMRYKVSSVMFDDDKFPDNGYHHKVTVLELKPLAGTPKEKAIDLVPFSPSGNTPDAFCRMEQGNKLLRVTVKNQGTDNAGASKTKVSFGESTLTLDTPPIPSGGSVDLLFQVPSNCFQPDCSFRITVDSNNQVNEANEGNNTASGGCVG